jgi:hypothetical protein
LDSLKIRKEFKLDLKQTINQNLMDYDAFLMNNNINPTRQNEDDSQPKSQGV